MCIWISSTIALSVCNISIHPVRQRDEPGKHGADLMKISRVWAMPDKWTFNIQPIREILNKYVGDGKGWIDPFAGENSPAEITNDINPERNSKYHLHALEFCKQFNGKSFNGVLFDPPYSLRQVKECYDSIGIDMSFDDSKMFPSNIKDMVSQIIKPSGISICFGWDSIGLGKNRGFEIVEILLVCHGGRHNDTIVTVERKINMRLDEHGKHGADVIWK